MTHVPWSAPAYLATSGALMMLPPPGIVAISSMLKPVGSAE